MNILVLGCGKKERPGNPDDNVITIDINDNVGADFVHNLDIYPWPVEENYFDIIWLDNVLEHLDNIIRSMEEIHRVAKPNASVTIIVPYFRSIWASLDPTHKHFFTVDTLSYFIDGHIYHDRYAYSKVKYKLLNKEFNKYIDKSWFRRLVLPWANKYPNFYETYFSHLYPMEDLTYELEVLK